MEGTFCVNFFLMKKNEKSKAQHDKSWRSKASVCVCMGREITSGVLRMNEIRAFRVIGTERMNAEVTV